LSSEVKDNRASVLALRGFDLLRLSLAARDGAWYITEIEDANEGLPALADWLRGALNPAASRARIAQLSYSQPDRALKQLEQLIAVEGESAPLLLLRARVLQAKQLSESLKKAEAEAAAGDGKEPPAGHEKKPEPPDEAAALLSQITKRWPEFAPAHYALAVRHASREGEAEKAIEPYRSYAQFAPLDPRPWRELGKIYQQSKRPTEAEAAYREWAARDRDYFEPQATLAAFYLQQAQPEKAKESLAAALKLAPEADDVFNSVAYDLQIWADGEPGKDESRRFEELLLAFPKEVAGNKTALRWLAEVQHWRSTSRR
jgi:Flp pilus assembly protein TadD